MSILMSVACTSVCSLCREGCTGDPDSSRHGHTIFVSETKDTYTVTRHSWSGKDLAVPKTVTRPK